MSWFFRTVGLGPLGISLSTVPRALHEGAAAATWDGTATVATAGRVRPLTPIYCALPCSSSSRLPTYSMDIEVILPGRCGTLPCSLPAAVSICAAVPTCAYRLTGPPVLPDFNSLTYSHLSPSGCATSAACAPARSGAHLVPFTQAQQAAVVVAMREVLMLAGPAELRAYREVLPDPLAPARLRDAAPSVELHVTFWPILSAEYFFYNATRGAWQVDSSSWHLCCCSWHLPAYLHHAPACTGTSWAQAPQCLAQ